MNSFKEIASLYFKLAQEGTSPFENYGLGLMTEKQRNKLIKEGKIKEQNGIDVVCIKRMGIIRLENGEFKTFNGKADNLIRFQMDEAKAYYKKQGKKIAEDIIDDFPVWNGVF